MVEPAGRLSVETVATPSRVSATVPNAVEPAVNVTVPEVARPPVSVSTVAVKVTLLPCTDGFGEETMLVVVGAVPTDWIRT